MNPLLVVLLLALIGLLGARLTFARRRVPVGPRIFVAIGGPFLFVGFALGPHVLRVLSPQLIDQLTPLLALGLGWIGLLFGLQLDRDHLRQFPPRHLSMAWLQAAIAFVVVLLVAYLITDAWFSSRHDAVLMVVAATACVSTPTAIALISNTYMTQGSVTRLLFFVGSVDAAIGILALGIIHAVYRVDQGGQLAAVTGVEWIAVSLLIGLLFGVLFLSLTRIRPRTQELLLLLIGLVLFAAGTAFYLSLSPLFVCMLTGAVIGNLSPMRRRVYVALSAWEKPIYIVLLVLAGASLRFQTWWIAPLAAVYVAGRLLAKWVGGLVAVRTRPGGLDLPGRFGLALTPQGGISLAIAISFLLIYVPEAQDAATALNVFFAIVVLAVGISDLLGPFLVRNVLERAGELHRRTAEVTPGLDT